MAFCSHCNIQLHKSPVCDVALAIHYRNATDVTHLQHTATADTLLLIHCNTEQQTLTLHTWTDHSLKELGVPFRMWYIYTSRQKRLALDQVHYTTP
jgi:hypothetical protein